jgi:protein-L-isoaspartate(D-aspartate) O-methyltransferase
LQDTLRHQGLRQKLVELLKQKGIQHIAALEAIGKIPRHFFLPPEFEHFAYQDKPFPIGNDQTISQPYTVAYQTQLIDPKPSEKILEIGTGSGYQAAVLALCGATVYSIERIPELHVSAKKRLADLKINVALLMADGTLGWAENAPYDKIIVTAAAPNIPRPLFNQLRIGGKLIIPVGKDLQAQQMIRLTKTDVNNFTTEKLENFVFVPLIGAQGWDL